MQRFESKNLFLVFQLRTFKVAFSGPKTFRSFRETGSWLAQLDGYQTVVRGRSSVRALTGPTLRVLVINWGERASFAMTYVLGQTF